MAKINQKILRSELGKALATDPKIRALAFDSADNRLAAEKDKFLQKFENHKVSQEIAAGPEAANTTNTLNGYGNLFSFIGFYSDSDPIGDAKEYFEQNIRIIDISSPKIINQVNQIKFSFKVNIPDFSDINNEEKLQMPEWDTGSWLFKIENGMSGLTHYMFKLINKFKASRSGTAVQMKNSLRDIIFKKRLYITPLLKELKSRLDSRAR